MTDRAGVHAGAGVSGEGSIRGDAVPTRSPFLTDSHFRRYWMSTAASIASRSMVTASLAWVALAVTGSEMMLASVAAAQYVPTLFFSLVAGGIADRVPRKTLLIATAILGSGLGFGLAAADAAGQITYWYLLAGSLIAGVLISLDFPARLALLPEIVSGDELFAAVSLTSATQQVGWFVGPLLVGAVAAHGSMSLAWLLSGGLSIAAGAALIGLRSSDQVSSEIPLLREIRAALVHVREDEVTPFVFAAVAVMALFIMNYQIFITGLTQRTLHLGPDSYGLLMGAMGSGALLGALWANRQATERPSLSSTLRFAGIAAALTLALSVAGLTFAAAALLVCGVGAAWTLFQAGALSLIQDLTPAPIRGKVLSGYALLSTGLTPLGYALSGFVAEQGGVPLAFAICGSCGLGGFALISIVHQRRIRPGLA